MKILEIVWEDSFTNTGPVETNEIRDDPLQLTCTGYLVKETESLLVIAMEVYPEDGRWRSIQGIDKKAIKSRKVIRK